MGLTGLVEVLVAWRCLGVLWAVGAGWGCPLPRGGREARGVVTAEVGVWVLRCVRPALHNPFML